MQVYGNVGTAPEQKVSKTTGKKYWQFRLAEKHRGRPDAQASWYTCRIMKAEDPKLSKGDFVQVVGEQRIDAYLGKDGKPAATAIILAFKAELHKSKADMDAARAEQKDTVAA
jgi:hypothetical protein